MRIELRVRWGWVIASMAILGLWTVGIQWYTWTQMGFDDEDMTEYSLAQISLIVGLLVVNSVALGFSVAMNGGLKVVQIAPTASHADYGSSSASSA